MRSLIAAVSVLLLCVSSGAMARGPRIAPHAMFYLHIPFDGGTGKNIPRSSFGFRMDEVRYTSDYTLDLRQVMRQTPFLDLKLGRDGLQSLYITGTDYLQRYRTLQAADNGDADAGATAQKPGDAKAGNGAKDGAAAKKEGKPEKVVVGRRLVVDFKNTLATIWKKAPVGILIGVGFGAALVAGAGN